MRGGVGQVQEERLRFRGGLIQELQGMLGEGVGHVEAFGGRRVGLVVERHLAPGIETEIITSAADEAEVAVEVTAAQGVVVFRVEEAERVVSVERIADVSEEGG